MGIPRIIHLSAPRSLRSFRQRNFTPQKHEATIGVRKQNDGGMVRRQDRRETRLLRQERRRPHRVTLKHIAAKHSPGRNVSANCTTEINKLEAPKLFLPFFQGHIIFFKHLQVSIEEFHQSVDTSIYPNTIPPSSDSEHILQYPHNEISNPCLSSLPHHQHPCGSRTRRTPTRCRPQSSHRCDGSSERCAIARPRPYRCPAGVRDPIYNSRMGDVSG